MARPKKVPKRYERTVSGTAYLSCNTYRADGTRTIVSFGPVPDDIEAAAKVHVTFSD